MIKSENLASQIFIQKLELLFIPQGRPVPRKANLRSITCFFLFCDF